MDVGFSGTQIGMTRKQYARVEDLLSEYWMRDRSLRAHHGDCIGADVHFHNLARRFGARMIGHPPVNRSKRAFCDFHEVREEKPYRQRNYDIVQESLAIITTPKGYEEELRSGTWMTIRMARRHEVELRIVLPDGSLYAAS